MSCCQSIGRRVLFRSSGIAWTNTQLYLSSMPRAVDKMSAIFEDYRKTNWPEELPSRVFKEILKAADENQDGKISLQEMEHFLEHIGASEKMTRADLVELLKELGAKDDMVDIRVIKEKFRDKRGMH